MPNITTVSDANHQHCGTEMGTGNIQATTKFRGRIVLLAANSSRERWRPTPLLSTKNEAMTILAKSEY